MSKEEKSMVIQKQGVFSKIKKIVERILNFFTKNKTITDNSDPKKIEISSKNNFIEYVSLKENKEDIEIIEKVKKDKKIIEEMSDEELRRLDEAIARRQRFLDKKIEQLKNEIIIKESKLRKQKNA